MVSPTPSADEVSDKETQVSVYLLHGPDEAVPVAETYSAIQTLYDEGRFDEVIIDHLNLRQQD